MNQNTFRTPSMNGLSAYIWAAFLAALGAAWALLNMRILRNERELDKQRENITKLFEKLEEHNAEDQRRFEQVVGKMHETQLTLIGEIRRIDAGRR